jgi:hypothetical protein
MDPRCGARGLPESARTKLALLGQVRQSQQMTSKQASENWRQNSNGSPGSGEFGDGDRETVQDGLPQRMISFRIAICKVALIRRHANSIPDHRRESRLRNSMRRILLIVESLCLSIAGPRQSLIRFLITAEFITANCRLF